MLAEEHAIGLKLEKKNLYFSKAIFVPDISQENADH